MGAWLSPGVPQSARKFAKWSAIGALALGVLGQVAYHHLSAVHSARAPWPVVVLVSSLPVVVLSFGAALPHLLQGEHGEPNAVSEVRPEGAPETLLAPAPESGSIAVRGTALVDAPASTVRSAAVSGPRVQRVNAKATIKRPKPVDLAMFYAADLEVGAVPSLRRIRADLHVGQDKAKQIQTDLTAAPSAAAPKPAPVAA
jgi:hypothetical protein